MKYTVSAATWYGGKWHLDSNTESAYMDESEVIAAGHKLAEMGAYPMYKDETGLVMVENPYKRLEPAFVEMVA